MDEIERAQLQARIADLLVLTRDRLRQKEYRKAESMAREARQLKQKLAAMANSQGPEPASGKLTDEMLID